ncbi:metal-sensing transcriptional repressor [Listeria grayi]|uniref:metal-sensing transcriptional repressor n=1 Tax=Listeria grayi TaxID=1641 RepID=UPI001625A51A|nr:metal-sensing transcriptional repressor [Listeria grayi]MBC1920823.1 metal-sensitive transcriptional regulator [Listeria grayi]
MDKDPIIKRLARIEGHVKSVSKMVTEERQIELIEQQILAVKKALDGVSRELFATEIGNWIRAQEQDEKKIRKQIDTFLR